MNWTSPAPDRLAPITASAALPSYALAGAARQHTLRSVIGCEGVGLHSGLRVALTLRPAEPGAGILFRRTDAAGAGAAMPARHDHVVDTRLCTVLADPASGVRIGTVEHIMAALAGQGIDNAVIEISGPEVPIMDGSAADFVFLIDAAGRVAQAPARRAIEVLAPVRVADGDAFAELLPARETGLFSLDLEIDFAAAAVARQERRFRMLPGAFAAELSRARTFGFAEEVEKLRALGLARGGSFENAIVVSGARILNREGLRFADEFVRHKMLDVVGDLALAGMPLVAHFHGRKCGHRLNNQLLHALFARPEAWRVIEAPQLAAAEAEDRAEDRIEPAPALRLAAGSTASESVVLRA